ncbi:MAG: N-acetylmuramoyl-L-alanine amidase [Simkania sp.]|nr:N-acetylmuramoyl-L-alanine amidase [Simkania sp.]
MMYLLRYRIRLLFILFFVPLLQLHALSTGASDPYAPLPLVVIDAGHGGSDEGAKVQTVMEKRITLTTVLLIKKHLESLGCRVILTRSRDIFVSLQKRVAIANKSKAALFVSVHFNSAPNRSAKGIEIFYSDSKDQQRLRASKILGNHVLQQMIDQTEAASRGVKRSSLYVLRETTMPAILVEGGFMTNFEERFLLKDRKYLDKIAKGVSQGIHKFLES